MIKAATKEWWRRCIGAIQQCTGSGTPLILLRIQTKLYTFFSFFFFFGLFISSSGYHRMCVFGFHSCFGWFLWLLAFSVAMLPIVAIAFPIDRSPISSVCYSNYSEAINSLSNEVLQFFFRVCVCLFQCKNRQWSATTKTANINFKLKSIMHSSLVLFCFS